MSFTKSSSDKIREFARALEEADAVVIGAGSGLSAAAGFTYEGERFERFFADFIRKYGITDMYSGGFYPFKSPEEYWAWWSRHVCVNRYMDPPVPVYEELLALVRDKEYFVITTNVDHCFQKAGFDKKRLFYTQGDYGLFQCSLPCHEKTYDNEEIIRQMVKEQRDMKIPPELVPHCPVCGREMTMNLRSDAAFVEDQGWHGAAARYDDFIKHHSRGKVLFLELGVGANTPGIIKYPFWQMTWQNPKATLVTIDRQDPVVPKEIRRQAIPIKGDIAKVLDDMRKDV